ncbi:hypothetical protein QR680_007280 [Steinernema hermaphroditum]|uniref:ParB/Sulfiredoxin domain-containing protein n=1 Tax=Steinernema hermaphroditum TaxID=289476 RepID=A0AA39HY91_9BILA|nr:hypothetical protein QR680_007280 [Steinernema hermaphroditum]
MEPSAAEELIRDYDQVLKDYDALPRYATRDDLAELHDYDFYTLHDREEQRSNADNGAQHFEGPFAVNEKDGEFFLVDGCRRRQAIMKKHGENEWQAVKVKCVVFKNLKLKEKAVVRFQPFVYLMKKEFSKPFDHGIMAQWTVGMWPQLPQTPERVKKYAKEIKKLKQRYLCTMSVSEYPKNNRENLDEQQRKAELKKFLKEVAEITEAGGLVTKLNKKTKKEDYLEEAEQERREDTAAEILDTFECGTNPRRIHFSETLMKSLILLLIAFAALLAVVDAQWGFYGHPHYYGPPHPPYHPPYWHPPHFHYDPYHGPHWHGWHKK